jgi:hypothetical protein
MTLVLFGGAAAVAQTIEPVHFSSQDKSLDAAPTAAPNGPTNLQALAIGTRDVVLLWQDNSNNETSFVVEGRASSETTFTALNPVPANVDAVFVTVPSSTPPGTTFFFRVRATNSSGNSAYSNVASVTTLTSDACVPSDTAMCLNSNRFRVQAMFLTPQGQSGDAHTVKLTENSGYLWFFGADNIEAIVKVLNACTPQFNRYWVFAGGLTNVRVLLAVTDTAHAATKVYINQQNRAFQPIEDAQAFATCP